MSARGTEVHAACAVQFTGGVPNFAWQSGEFDAAAFVDNGAGDITLTFNAANGVDITEIAWDVQPLFNAARVTIAVEALTDTTTRFRIYDQVTAGLLDVPFSAIAYKLVII